MRVSPAPTTPDEDEVYLVFENFPVEGTDAVVKDIAFGPVSEDFVILVEFNPLEGPLRVTVGNGPSNEEAPTVLARTLRDIATAIESLEGVPEYWNLVNETTSKGE